MSPFRRERPPRRDKILSLRVSGEEDQMLEELRQRLGLANKVDVFRQALDYFVANAPEAQPRKGKS